MRRKVLTAAATLAVSAGTAFGTAGVAYADNPSVSETTATCITSGSSGVEGTPWTGKNPEDCSGEYRLYDITRGRPTLIAQIDNADSIGIKEAVAGDYASAQDWCADNSLSCSILTGAGFFVLGILVNR
ncbi:hypothetical protein GCM10009625_20800 [Brachybacterium fresconis]